MEIKTGDSKTDSSGKARNLYQNKHIYRHKMPTGVPISFLVLFFFTVLLISRSGNPKEMEGPLSPNLPAAHQLPTQLITGNKRTTERKPAQNNNFQKYNAT